MPHDFHDFFNSNFEYFHLHVSVVKKNISIYIYYKHSNDFKIQILRMFYVSVVKKNWKYINYLHKSQAQFKLSSTYVSMKNEVGNIRLLLISNFQLLLITHMHALMNNCKLRLSERHFIKRRLTSHFIDMINTSFLNIIKCHYWQALLTHQERKRT